MNSLLENIDRINNIMFLNEQGSADFMVDRKSKELSSSVKKKHSESVQKYKCVNEKFANPVSILLEKGYNKEILKLALGIIGRESSFEEGLRYAVLNPVKELWAWFGGDTSVGPAQMKIDTAESLGLDLSDISSRLGALDGAYRKINRSIKLAKRAGYTNEPSNLGNTGTGNAIYDIAIAAYNTGDGKVILDWCESKIPERKEKGLKNKCSDKFKSDTTKKVKNYIPNLTTTRDDAVNTTTHGYIKEVANTFKKTNCI
jgi:hypothetical protein